MHIKNMRLKGTLVIYLLSLSLFAISTCRAELSERNWPIIKEAFFQQRHISSTDLIQLSVPLGAENAGQVPITLSVNNQLQDAINKVYIFIDANPVPLAVTYHFPQFFNQLTVSTRVRLDSDSNIRVIAETLSGRLLMSTARVNAGGGCAGSVTEDDAVVRASAGTIRFQLNAPYKLHETASATLQIKHPMYTGLQTDAKTRQRKPAFYVKNVDIRFDELSVMQMMLGVGTSENPYILFNFDLPEGLIKNVVKKVDITTEDNDGKVVRAEFL